MPGSCTSVRKHSTVDKCITVYGISEREKSRKENAETPFPVIFGFICNASGGIWWGNPRNGYWADNADGIIKKN